MTKSRTNHPAPFEFKPLGEAAVLLDFGNVIDLTINRQVHDRCRYIDSHPFPGFIETVPAYASLAVFYDPVKASAAAQGKPAYQWVCEQLTVAGPLPTSGSRGNHIRIPVLYDGPDLNTLAESRGLTVEEVVKLHSSVTYDAFMVGFLPGFAYLGEVDERIAVPRKASPRKSVPAGSVGIAGKQTGIYPMNSPGGWQLIGRTPLKMFDPQRPQPCLVQAGDRVQFEPITEQQFLESNGH